MQMGRSFQKLMAGNLLHTEVVGLECETFTRDSRTINSRRSFCVMILVKTRQSAPRELLIFTLKEGNNIRN